MRIGSAFILISLSSVAQASNVQDPAGTDQAFVEPLFERAQAFWEWAVPVQRVSVPTVNVVVAKTEIPPGETLTSEHLQMVSVPAGTVASGTFVDKDAALGMVTVERILMGERVRGERLQVKGGELWIPRGLRAITLPIDDRSSSPGFVSPGNYVDLVFAKPEDDQGPAHTQTVAQMLHVLRVTPRTVVNGQEVGPSATMLITPNRAEQVTQILQGRHVTLSLCGDIQVLSLDDHGPYAKQWLTPTIGPTPVRPVEVPEFSERYRIDDFGHDE